MVPLEHEEEIYFKSFPKIHVQNITYSVLIRNHMKGLITLLTSSLTFTERVDFHVYHLISKF